MDDRIEALRADLALAEGRRKAFVTVIGVYGSESANEAVQRPTRSDRSTSARRVTDLLKGRDLHRGILKTLRDAESPIFATEVSQRNLSRERLATAAEGLLTVGGDCGKSPISQIRVSPAIA